MERVVTKELISYQMFDSLMTELVDMIKDRNQKYSAILPIPRGGLPLATHLSHHLGNIPIISDVNDLSNKGFDLNILVVDDICDTGFSLDIVHKILTRKELQFTTACLHYKPHSNFAPDIYVKETTDWIVYPWELINEKPNREMYEHLGGEEE